MLLDREHVLSETYAITNVPTVVWIDEDDHIVRPNSPTPGNDMFIEFSGISSEPSKAAIRRWARDGEVDLQFELPVTPASVSAFARLPALDQSIHSVHRKRAYSRRRFA